MYALGPCACLVPVEVMSDLPELECWISVNHQMSAGNQTRGLGKSRQ